MPTRPLWTDTYHAHMTFPTDRAPNRRPTP